jgi:uncharacterized membrane protein YkvA (DUF1232 family)
MSNDALTHLADTENINERAEDWYTLWRGRIHGWVADNVDSNVADVVLAVPDMVVLLMGLAQDRHVPVATKAKIALALAYVLSPIDLVPEALLGVAGLADDAGVMVVLLFAIQQLGSVEPEVVRKYWRGGGDAIETINNLYGWIERNADRMFGHKIWSRIKRAFGGNPEDSHAYETDPDLAGA